MYLKKSAAEYVNLESVVRLTRHDQSLVILHLADGSEIRSSVDELRDKIDGIDWDEDLPAPSHGVYNLSD